MGKGVFEQLVHNLDDNDRKAMLNGIREGIKKHETPDEKEHKEQKRKDREFKQLKAEYENIAFIKKIQLFIKRILTGKTVYALVKEQMFKKLGKSIESAYPGFIDIKESKVKEPYFNEINMLKNSLPEIYEIFKVVDILGNADFYQFVAASEMSELEETLEKNTDPDFIMRTGLVSEREKVRNEIMKQYHEILDSVDSLEKEKVYEIVRGFFLLKKIVSLNYDGFIKKIEYEANGNKFSYFRNCRKTVKELYEIIFNMDNSSVPFKKVLKYMAEYYYEKEDISVKLSKEDFLSKMLVKLGSAYNAIESFSKNTPSKDLVRYLYRDLYYEPGRIIGGEEWFSVYKKYLKEKMDKKYELFIKAQQRNDILERLKFFIKTLPEEKDTDFTIEIKDRIYKFEGITLLLYFKEMKKTFYQENVEEIVSTLLIDGAFYKDANKKELYEAYHFINNIDDDYKEIIRMIEPESEEIKSINSYSFDESSKKLQKKKTKNFIEKINRNIQDKYFEYYKSFMSVSNILYGIVNGNINGNYDTISNAGDLCKETTFMSFASISSINNNLKEVLGLFSELSDFYIMKSP